MVRWTGLLALLAGAVLVGLLASRTEKAEVRGTVRANSAADLFPERSPLVLVTILADATVPEALLMTGLNLSGSEEKEDGEPTGRWIWEVELPIEAARTAQPGDDAGISVRRVECPGVDGDYVRLLRCEFRRASTTWSSGGPSNGMFLAAYGLAGGGPLLLWAMGAGIAVLCRAARRRD